jgi:pimeloyl-ACP methyl ester carboxylesterase
MKHAPEPSAAKRAACACILSVLLGACQSLAPDRSATLSQELAESIRTAGSPSVSERERRQAAAVYRERLAATFPSRLAESVDPGPAVLRAVPREERSGITDPGDFDQIAAVRQARETRPGLHRAGLGLPVLGRLAPDDNPNAPEAGFKVPLTLAALPPEGGRNCCDSVLLDPRRIDRLKIDQGEVPLAMDIEAALRTADATGPRFGSGIANLLRPGLFAGHPRILFLEPFDPNRRPLVLVHGLLSTHRIWTPLLLDLLTDPVIRQAYQIWFFYYPTGQPVPLSALQLREALDEVAARWNPRYPMVLVGHSMGGILARAQVSHVGPDVAETVLPGVSRLPADSRVRRALLFEPRRDVSRVVFMFTPHRGSRLASGGLGAWGIRLIRLPGTLAEEVSNALGKLTGAEIGRIPTSIHGLSPDSLFLRILHATRPQVPVHSIMGDRGRGDGWAGSDGVVPYISSHLSFAQSEVVVPTGHGGFDHPRAVAELKRILRLELARPDQAQIVPDVATEEIGTQGIVDLVNLR